MAVAETVQVPEAFAEVIVYSNEGQCSLVGRRQRALYRNVMHNYRTVSAPGGFPVHTPELLNRLNRGEEAWVPDIQSSEDSADEEPVKPTLKRLPKNGAWSDRRKSPMMYCSSDSSNSDDEPHGESEEEKTQRGGHKLMPLHRSVLASSKGSLKPREACKNWLQLKKCARSQVVKIKSNIAEAGGVNVSTARETTSTGENGKTCPDCGQSFKSGLSLSNHQRIHGRRTPYKCSICGERFTAKKILASHHRRHAEEKGYKHPSSEKRATKYPKFAPAPRQSVTQPRHHKCPLCEKRFLLKKDLLWHERVHATKRPRRSHAVLGAYKCPRCGKGFSRKEHLARHKKIHTRKVTTKISEEQEESAKAASCDGPEKKPSKARVRKRMVRSDIGDAGPDLYKCQFCGKSLRTKIMLIEHKRTHTEKRPHTCSLCKKSFFYKQSLQNHEKTHRKRVDNRRRKQLGTRSSASSFETSHTAEHASRSHIARKVITRSLGLAQPQKVHVGKKLHKCQYCGKCLSSKDGLANHERIHRGEKPFRCDECGKCFRQKQHLINHLRAQMKQKTSTCIEHVKGLDVKDPLSVPKTIHKGLKPHQGLVLGEATRNVHLTGHSTVALESSLFKCQYCGKCTQTKTSLLHHERIHKGKKPYQCLECGKKFSQKNYLDNHQRGHMKKKLSSSVKKLTTKYSSLTFRRLNRGNVVCLKCEKCFSDKNHLKRHQKIHSGTKPFSCATCGKGFIQSWHLKRHEKIHLKKIYHKQPEANSVFPCSTSDLFAKKDPINIKQQVASTTVKRNLTRNVNALQHHEQDKPSYHWQIQPRKSSSEAHVLQSCTEKKGFAPQHLGLWRMTTRTSKRETQLAGKQARSCFCQLDKPEITPGRRSQNLQNCRNNCKSPQKNMTISSDLSQTAPKCCKPTSPCVDQPSRSTFLPGLLAANELQNSDLPNLGAVSQQNQRRFVSTEVKQVSSTSGEAGPGGLMRPRESQRTILRNPKSRSPKKKVITDLDGSEQMQAVHSCTMCKKSFRTLGNLLIHEKNHTGNRPFLCMYCGKSFYNISTLRVHVRIHTGEKPFKCSECPFRCNVSSNLSRHKRTHVRERPHPCRQCGKRFWYRHSLLSHLKTHDQKEPHTCCDCGRVFTHENFLKLHRRFKHHSEVQLPPSGEK